jgi:hypothetical protein
MNKKFGYKSYHYIVEKAEPWTRKELNAFSKQERTFIRDIQITKKLNKKSGINFYMNYLHKSKNTRRQLRKEIIDKIHDIYPKHKKTSYVFKEKTKHYIPKSRPIVKKDFSSKYKTFEDWYVYGNTDVSSSYFRRIVIRHNKHPNKTLKQLRGEE